MSVLVSIFFLFSAHLWMFFIVRKPNSWTYNFVEVSGHHLESSQTWRFRIQCLHYKPVSNPFARGGGELVEVRVNSKEENSEGFSFCPNYVQVFGLSCRLFLSSFSIFLWQIRRSTIMYVHGVFFTEEIIKYAEADFRSRPSICRGWNFKELLRKKLRIVWDWTEVLSKVYNVPMRTGWSDLRSSLCPYYVYAQRVGA
jgi:hypothetical protein